MNIFYVNLVPKRIEDEQIHAFLKEFVDYIHSIQGGVDISIKNAEDMYPGVNAYIGSVLNYYCRKDREGVAGVDGFLKALNNYHSIDEVERKKVCLSESKDKSIYDILAQGFREKIVFEDCKIVIISGEKYYISAPYGVACESVCVNRCLEKYSIWHETAHLFDVDDHYDPDIDSYPTICGDEKCFMQWNSLRGEHFCSKAISEISSYLSR